MKKLLFVNNNMQIGGIQKALCNLLWAIDGQYDITLFLFHKQGELLKDLPPSVKVLEANPFLKMLGMPLSMARSMGKLYYIIRAGFGMFSRYVGSRIPIFLSIFSAKKLTGYDIAIAYMQNSDPKIYYGGVNDFVLRRIEAKKKATFVHCDFQNYEGNCEHNRKLYQKFDQIISVSESVKKTVDHCMPHLKDRSFYAINCYRYDEIDRMANQDTVHYAGEPFVIITLARLSAEKGVSRCIPMMAKLKSEGYRFTWHILGDGACCAEVEEAVSKYDLKSDILLHGEQENPYRYLKNANLLLVPSYHEGAPMVFYEAAHLGVPILSTNTCSAKEMVEKTGYGWVCENSEEGILKQLQFILAHPDEYQQKVNDMVPPKDNETAIRQIGALW